MTNFQTGLILFLLGMTCTGVACFFTTPYRLSFALLALGCILLLVASLFISVSLTTFFWNALP